jgi:pimeloyl-ACP methyl ester carboxylesterase
MSQGGRIALRYAATRPQRIRSLLLQGAVVDGFDVPDHDDDHVPVAEFARLAKDGKLVEVVEHWLRHPMMWLGDKHESEYRLIRNILEDYPGSDLINYDEDSYAFDSDVLSALANFPRPTLLLTGARETRTRRLHADALRQRIPCCSEVILEQSGHLSNLSESRLFNQAVIDFCTRVDEEALLSGSGTLD